MKEVLKNIYCSETFDNAFLLDIIHNPYDGLMVSDKKGELLCISAGVADDIGMSISDILGKNVQWLMDNGYYSDSTILQCIREKKTINSLLRVQNGHYVFSTTRPIFDRNGDLQFTVTNIRVNETVAQISQEFEREKRTQKKYLRIAKYFQQEYFEKEEMIAVSDRMKEVKKFCEEISFSDSTVLIMGESGTGKEVVAKYIYNNSQRVDKPFLPLNCGAIPENLIESELFGYEKGAFTGANSRHIGLFEMANEGTVFLDEIGELPLYLQPRLLRILEEGEVKRVGGNEAIKVDVRIIAATNRDLLQMVEEGKFRRDLYYRLNVLPVNLPALRERKSDIRPLVELFLKKYNKKMHRHVTLSDDIISRLERYSWPGNIRELRNVVERYVVTQGSGDFLRSIKEPEVDEITIENIMTEVVEKDIRPLAEAKRAFENRYIENVIKACNGNITKASKLLGIHRSLIYKKNKEK